MAEEKNVPVELSRETALLMRNVSGAMREALNGSMAASELLSRKLEREDREEEQEYLAILRRDQHKLLRIAENLTALAGLTLEEETAGEELQDLNVLCGELADTLSALIRRVRFRFVPCAGDCWVSGTRDQLESLILNVLAYSLARCGEGNTITLRAERGKQEVYLHIRDDAAEGESFASLYSAPELDPMRSIALGGAGLGMLVAEKLARRRAADAAKVLAADSELQAG